MRKILFLFVVIVSIGMTGCGSRHMQPIAPEQMNETVNPDKAAIVFFRPSRFRGGGLNPGIIEVDENEKLSFVAIISNGTKYLHRTTPGRHWYFWSSGSVLGGLASYILEANLEAGKIYYVDAFFDPSFAPVTDTSDESFRKKLASCRWVENTPAGQIWFNNNLLSLQNKYTLARIRQADETPKVKVGSSEFDMIIKPEYGTNTPVQ